MTLSQKKKKKEREKERKKKKNRSSFLSILLAANVWYVIKFTASSERKCYVFFANIFQEMIHGSLAAGTPVRESYYVGLSLN